MLYSLNSAQTIFIRRLLTGNFSPSFSGMLKRVLREKVYNETERTRIKEIRLSYIKKKIIPRGCVNKLVDDVNDVTLTNIKL